MKLRAKVDSNQPQIVSVFRKMGCSVAHTHQIGKGFPDIVISLKTKSGSKTLAVEIKDGDKVKSARKLTYQETIFHEYWQDEIPIIETVEDAINLVNRLKEL